MTTMEQVLEILGEYKDLDNITVTEATPFAQLELDSLDVVDMVMACEEKFGVTLEFDESMKTVGDLIALIEAA